MKFFADLHLCPPLDDATNAGSMAEVLNQIEIALVGVVVAPDRLTTTLPVMNSFKDAGIDVAKRLDLRPRSREELLNSLRRHRSNYDVVAVSCSTESVSRVAVRDRRVDVVQFPKQGPGSFFRKNLANTCRAAVEFNVSELIQGQQHEVRLGRVRREIEIAAGASTSLVGCSGASNCFELRAPRDMAALLQMVGLSPEAAMASVSKVPLAIVKQNRLRTGPHQLEEGVRIVKGSTKHE
jgi:ribonuclease P/MRP protein subunit RPP1